MGLDMGLRSRPKESSELAYWRKANQIRGWFADNLDGFNDNGETRIDKEDLEALLDTCKKVLDNHDLASELLPVTEGFFFGNNEYDAIYFDEVEETVEQINQILETFDWENENMYYWEWY